MAHMNRHAELHGQLVQGDFPQAAAAAVAAPAIGGDQQFLGIAIALRSHLAPPAPDGFRGESSRVVIDTYAHPALILAQVVHPVRNGFAQIRIQKIVDLDLFRIAARPPLAPGVLERSDQFLLLRVDRDHRLPSLLKPLYRRVDILELRIAIRMVFALFGLAVALQAVTVCIDVTRCLRARGTGSCWWRSRSCRP